MKIPFIREKVVINFGEIVNTTGEKDDVYVINTTDVACRFPDFYTLCIDMISSVNGAGIELEALCYSRESPLASPHKPRTKSFFFLWVTMRVTRYQTDCLHARQPELSDPILPIAR